MTDIRADEPTPLDRDDRLPWLEAVTEEDERDGPSLLKLIVAVLIGLAAIGAIVGGIFWMTNQGSDQVASGEAELIPAPQGDYKVKPSDPGGMQVEGEGDSAFAASAGGNPKATLNTNQVPEAPATKAPQQPAAPAQQPAATPEPTIPAPAPTPSAGPGGSIQLGAFSSQAGANSAWKAMSGRFKYLSGLTHSVVPVTAGGKPLYRLRASGPGAAGICNRLKVAGESCVAL